MSKQRKNHKKLPKEKLKITLVKVLGKFECRLERGGYDAFSSRYEILGKLESDMQALRDTSRRDITGQHLSCLLEDIARTCIAGIASVDADTLDW